MFAFLKKYDLSITFVNNTDAGQATQNVGPDLDPNCLTLIIFLKDFALNFQKKKIEKKNNNTKHAKLTKIFAFF